MSTGWWASARPADAVIDIDRVGESGSGTAATAHLGLTAARVVAAAPRSVAASSG
jgi:transketolase